ncbi:DNA-binding protein [Izhakiella australiensis]|uniref:DNA-binding protein n=1 Tax=Izhakiella australiensis TaxID=1926881 RepID=A0A1S8YNP6_9GAMM|nr:DNA-binding protein [Izhakiella australiensis]OON40789.1 DNA-binding protein [Izhakiella australiensis]
MSGVTINLNVASPYLSLKEYARVTGIPFETCRDMVKDGRIIIRPKKLSGEKVEVNMVAMLKDAIANS